MKEYFQKYSLEFEKIDLNNLEEVLQFGYRLHLDFVKIHPFIDGNGRAARLIMNLWFLYAINNLNIVYFKNREEYIASLETVNNDLQNYYTVMNSNFLEFKKEELELIENKEIYKY